MVNAPEFTPVANVMYFTPPLVAEMSAVNRVVATLPKIASAPVVGGTPPDQFPPVFQSVLTAPSQVTDPASTRSHRKPMKTSCGVKSEKSTKNHPSRPRPKRR